MLKVASAVIQTTGFIIYLASIIIAGKLYDLCLIRKKTINNQIKHVLT